MSGFLGLLLRSRWEPREWPRYRAGARADEREWLDSLSDRELAEHAAALHAIDQAVDGYRRPPAPNVLPLLRGEEKP
jgi:hypothetical protein